MLEMETGLKQPQPPQKRKPGRPRKVMVPEDPFRRAYIQLRYLNENHREIIEKAAEQQGLSRNSWLIQVTLAAARQQLGIKL